MHGQRNTNTTCENEFMNETWKLFSREQISSYHTESEKIQIMKKVKIKRRKINKGENVKSKTIADIHLKYIRINDYKSCFIFFLI